MLAEFLEKHVGRPAVVVGHSLGAMCAALVAGRVPEQVRALVLEDPHGERVALVVADLPFISTLLYRWTADELTRSGTGIGADRLLLSATHTHAAPGNLSQRWLPMITAFDPFSIW